MNGYGILSTISAGTLNINNLALVVTAIAVTCFTVVFTVLFVSYRKFACAELDSGKRDIELIEQFFYDKKKSSVIKKKALSILKTVIYTLVMAFITVCLVFTVFVRFSQNMPNGTKSLMAIATNSMSEKNENNDYLFNYGLNNQFPAQSIIVLEKIDPKDVKQYDVIAFRLSSGITLVHRVRSINYDENGNVTYATRGDLYASDDKGIVLGPDDVVGRYTGRFIPYFGAFVLFLQSASGIVTVIALIFCLVMFDRNTGKIAKVQADRTDYLIEELGISDVHEDSEITVDFVEKIYLDKVGYLIRDNTVKVKKIDDDEVSCDNSSQKVVSSEKTDETVGDKVENLNVADTESPETANENDAFSEKETADEEENDGDTTKGETEGD